MTKEPTIKTEQVGDVPLLIAHEKKMLLPELIDKHFPAHGNRTGLSVGWVTTVWLSHIVSESDHRLNHVQEWVGQIQETLRHCTGQPLVELDFTDDRLEDVLRLLSNDEAWLNFERELNRKTIRIYKLSTGPIRIDSTTAMGYGQVTEDGLWQYGYSKDKRPDLPQLKVNLATLDPLGMPLVTAVLQGQEADDPLYIPTVKEIKKSVPSSGLLYVADSKMGSIDTRYFIESQHDYYLCPLSLVQLPQEKLNQYIEAAGTTLYPLQDIYKTKADGKKEKIAQGYMRTQNQTQQSEDNEYSWNEQHFVVRSLNLATAAEKALRERIEKATKALEDLPKPRQRKKRLNLQELQETASAISKYYGVNELLQISCREATSLRHIRCHKDRPARYVVQTHLSISVSIDQPALAQAISRLGWRVYATNAPQENLNLEQAVLAYRQEFIIEREFGRLKGKSLSLSPVYLQHDDYATGLVRLLSIGLRVLTLLEFVVRRSLKDRQQSLSGLYAGNPKRTTAQPTAASLLLAFSYIYLTVLQEDGDTRRFLTSLTPLHIKIIDLLGFSDRIYLDLTTDFKNSS